jgi:DNA-binding transcriptional regulator YiaG
MLIKNSDFFDIDIFLQKENLDRLRIKSIRKTYGMTQVNFADLLGVAYDTYCSWELGVRKPSSPACA